MTVRSMLWRGSAALVGGRLTMSAGRLLAAVLVGRLAGVDELGAFTMLLSLIAIFEWIADFGQTDIAIREIGRNPKATAAILRELKRWKLAIAAVVIILMPIAALAVGGAAGLVPAAAIAAIGVGALALAQPDRALVRSELRPWLDVSAEMGGFLVFLVLVAIAATNSAPLAALAGAYAAFRLSYFAILHGLARPARSRLAEMPPQRFALGAAALPLGVAGLLVALYDNVAPLLLSHLADLRAVGEFAAAARFAFPVVMIVQAITTAFFPALSGEHGRPDGRLAELQQGALEASLVSAGLLFAGLHGAASFLVGLVANDTGDAAQLLRLLAWLVLVRAVTTAMSPLIVVGGRQSLGLVLTCLSLAVQVAAIFLLVPRLGIVGVGWGYLIVELTLGVVPVSLLGLWATGIRLSWGRPAAILACAAASAAIVSATPLDGDFGGGVLAGLLFAALIGLGYLLTRSKPVALLAALQREGAGS